jgi:hypothetical protein
VAPTIGLRNRGLRPNNVGADRDFHGGYFRWMKLTGCLPQEKYHEAERTRAAAQDVAKLMMLVPTTPSSADGPHLPYRTHFPRRGTPIGFSRTLTGRPVIGQC